MIILPQARGVLAANAAAATVFTWDPVYKGANVTLSNGNMTALFGAGGSDLARGTVGQSTGKFYFEVFVDVSDNLNSVPMIGLVDNTVSVLTSIGDTAGSGWAFWADSRTWDNGAQQTPSGTSQVVTNDVVMVAVDFGAGYVWFGKNGSWLASGNPGTGANPLYTTISGTLYPAAFSATSHGVTVTARFTDADFDYARPTGFSAWGFATTGTLLLAGTSDHLLQVSGGRIQITSN